MIHELYAGVDELLAPETLTELSGQRVSYVRCLPSPGGNSGASLLSVEASHGRASTRYILKRMARSEDWVMLASDDRHCRSLTLWQSGLLDRLQPGIDHAIVASARDGDGWALLMRDVTPSLLGLRAFTTSEVYCTLDALAALHAAFWEDSALAEPALGLCDALGMLRVFSPANDHCVPSSTSRLPQLIAGGWEVLQAVVEPDVADLLRQLVADPQPLCAALAHYPSTLVHGDYRSRNMGLVWHEPPQLILLDWQLAGYSAATVDLAWFLENRAFLLSPVAPEAAVDYYRQQLAGRLGARFDESYWQPLLELGLLANILRLGHFTAWFLEHPVYENQPEIHRCAIARFNEQVRAALKWL